VALEGTLETCGISEILQLVSQQGKTGTLEIRAGTGTATMRFRRGKLVEAWPDPREAGELIGERLVRAGLLTPSQLEHGLSVQKSTLRPLGDVLIRSGAVRVSDFREVLALQHSETVFRLLRLTRGSFAFRPEPVEVEEAVSAPMEVGGLLMEGFRQLDEWPKLLQRVPSERHVYEPTGKEGGDELTQAESSVLELVDGRATVREVVDRSRLGEFVAWEAMAHLYERGLVGPSEGVRPVGPRKARRRGVRAADALVSVVLLLLAAAAVFSWPHAKSNGAGALSAIWTEARAEASRLQARASEWNREGPRQWPALPPTR
jgi:hypothetical protein